MKVDPRHEFIEIKHRSKAHVNDPLVLSQQTVQVYYTPFLSKERERKDCWAVYKVKSRVIHYEPEQKEEEPHLPK